jgi:hypothetical protein
MGQSGPPGRETRPTRDLLRGKPSGSGIGPERALEANKPIPSRGSARADPSQSLLSERRPSPAEHPHDQAHSSPSARGPKPDAGSGDPAYKGPFSGATPAAAGSGRSEPWRRTKPIPRAAARKLILPRASSASAGPVPRSTPNTPSGAGSGRSEPWRRTNPSPRAAARKLILPRASSASAGTVPRSTPNTPSGAGSGRSEPWRRTPKIPRAQRESSSSPEPPQRTKARSRGAPQTRPAERDRSRASLGGEQTHSLARQRES